MCCSNKSIRHLSTALLTILIMASADSQADFTVGESVNLGSTVNSISNEQGPNISADGLELYFSEYSGAPFRPGGSGLSDIWVTSRQTKDDPWGIPVNLGSVVNSSANDEHPSITADGLSLYFGSKRPQTCSGVSPCSRRVAIERESWRLARRCP